jgi:hypothetical protein
LNKITANSEIVHNLTALVLVLKTFSLASAIDVIPELVTTALALSTATIHRSRPIPKQIAKNTPGSATDKCH